MSSLWIKTHCARFDHGGCGLRVHVQNGKPVEIRPDAGDPFSRGYSCAKGMAALERLEHPLRLTHPLRRRGQRGRGEWERIGWDDALDLLTEKFSQTLKACGPEGIAFAQGTPKGPEFFLLLRLANLLGCPNVAAAQHICHMPRDQMATVTCGFFPVADLEHPTRCILLWGSNPLNTNEEGVLGGHVINALKHDPALIVVDPVRTELARKADIWLQIRPGSDDLLALGFLHILVEERLYDRGFVERWTVGFDELKAAVKEVTPQRVAEGTWIPVDKLLAAARIYGRSRPALIHWGNAIEHSANSAHTCRSLVLLMALCGNLEAPGGNIRAKAPKLRRLAEFIRLQSFPERPQKLLNRHFGIMPRLLTVPNWILIKSILDQHPYPIRSLYLQGTNPLISYAHADVVESALRKLDFLAVADQVMTPTAALADLVLPVALPLEYNDIGHYGLPHGYVLARPAVCRPKGECWPDMKILNEWGRRMGHQEDFWEDHEQILEDVLAPSGLTYDAFAQQGILRGEKRYFTYREKGFATPSGKVELRSSLLEKWGFSSLPAAQDPPEAEEEFPLLLTSAKPKYFFHSAYRHLDMLRKRHPTARLTIHPETAASLKIESGEEVRVATLQGSIILQAHVSDRTHPGVVVADYGWWYPETGEEGLYEWKRSNLNCLTQVDEDRDPIMGTTQMRAFFCRVDKA